MMPYTDEQREAILAARIKRQKEGLIRNLFERPLGPWDGSLLRVRHNCGHIVKYENKSLEMLLDRVFGEVEQAECPYCVLSNLGMTLDGCWK